jgi:hypothetical protein
MQSWMANVSHLTPAVWPLILVCERLPGVLQPGYQRLAALGLHGVEELL